MVIRQQVMFLLLGVSLPYHSISIPLWRKCLGLLLPKPSCCTLGSEGPDSMVVMLNLARHRCSWHTSFSLYSKNSKKKKRKKIIQKKPWSFNEYRLVSGLVSMGTTIGWLSDRPLDNTAFLLLQQRMDEKCSGSFKEHFYLYKFHSDYIHRRWDD